ncbi:MAG: nicotinate-nicotinamide nucleotide adenylyltransferase [Bacteroidales bacterium]|nr:nicotinate-nicotinamide nucleotide adenylyltransferase [Bacteroidales bacterium]
MHIGHKAIMEYLTRGQGFEWVYLIVSPQNPFKDPSLAEKGEQRYLAAVEAVKRHPGLRVWVDDIELHRDPPQYTIDTLDLLREREPDNDFTLVIGADNLDRFFGWRQARRILTEYGIVVYPRPGYDAEEAVAALRSDPEGDSFRIRILSDAPQFDISSTEIRKGLEEGLDMSEYLM